MMTDTDTRTTTQVYRVYIKASAQAIWDAITKPEWSERYGYGGRVEYDLRPGGTYRAFASDDMRKARAEMGWPDSQRDHRRGGRRVGSAAAVEVLSDLKTLLETGRTLRSR